jgi:hypothetical protein
LIAARPISRGKRRQPRTCRAPKLIDAFCHRLSRPNPVVIVADNDHIDFIDSQRPAEI